LYVIPGFNKDNAIFAISKNRSTFQFPILEYKKRYPIGYDEPLITEEMLDEELKNIYLDKLDDHLSRMSLKYKDLFFRLSLSIAEEMARYAKKSDNMNSQAGHEV
jgi:hypothetical protein